MAKSTKLEDDIRGITREVLSGYLLAIDPSSGSRGSQPGYAIYEGGLLKDSGFINVGSGDAIEKRLHRLSQALHSEFKRPDVLVTEALAAFFGSGGGAQWSTNNVISLHQSVGVCLAAWDAPVAKVSPRTWRSMIPENYLKSDESDAIMLGFAAITTACRLEGRELPKMDAQMLSKLSTGEWLK